MFQQDDVLKRSSTESEESATCTRSHFLRLWRVKRVFRCRLNSPCDVRPRRAEDFAVQLDAAALGDSVHHSIRGQDLRGEL